MPTSELPPDWTEPTIIGVYLKWIYEKGRSEETQRIYRGVLRNLAYWLQMRRDVTLLAATHLQLRAWRSNLKLSDSSITTYVTIVRGFYEWAHRSHLVDDDPAWNLPAPPLKPGYPHPIPENDLLLAVRVAPPKIRVILVLAAYTGLRAAEIAGLRREHLRDDLPHPVIKFRGKGDKERIVPLPAYVFDTILECVIPLPHRGHIIRRGDGRPGPNRPRRISQLANGYLHDLGIPDTLHSLRHRFGTRAADASNGNLLAVGELMGHASTNTTKRYTAYANPLARSIVDAIQPKGNDPAVSREVADPPS